MVEPTSLQNDNLILQEAKSILPGRFSYWIGITNGGDHKYQSDGSPVTWEMNFNDQWQKERPFTKTKCIYMYSVRYGWNSGQDCTDASSVYTVCEVETD